MGYTRIESVVGREEGLMEYVGYCSGCKERKIFTGKVIVTDSNREVAKGECEVCQSPMSRILGRI